MQGGPYVVWPAPGYPALLEAEQNEFSMIVAHEHGLPDTLHRWAGHLALQGKSNRTTTPLDVVRIEALSLDGLDPPARGFAGLADARDICYARVRMRASRSLHPAPPRSVELYDLAVQGSLAKSRAVAVFADARRQLSLAFASDLHIAAFWTEIIRAIGRHAPQLLPAVVDPVQMLHRFIDEANALCADGALDLIVLGGDLVDHVHQRPRRQIRGRSAETNVHRFVELLAPLRVPTIAIPGNHDHRLFPWRPRTYGLKAIGLSADRSRQLLQAGGLWDRWPLHWDDFNALRTVDDAGRPGLTDHLTLLAPATDFAVDLRGLRLVFASTGADAIARWRHTEAVRIGALIRSLFTSWTVPESEGFYDEQVRQLAESLQGARGAAVFFHSPLLHARDHRRIEECLGRLDVETGTNSESPAALERRWRRAGIRQGVCFRNPGEVARELLSVKCPLVTFSGHVHRGTAIAWDRTTFGLRPVPLQAPQHAARTMMLLTAPAVGQVGPGDEGLPGYLLCRFEDGKLVSLARRTLPCFVPPRPK